jgi:signal transduction histidine kinase
MNPPPTLDSITDDSHRRGQLVLRTLPILLVPLFVAIATGLILYFAFGVIPNDRPPFATNPIVLIISLAIFFSALIMLVRMGRAQLSVYLLIGVWTLFTTWVALQFGVTSIWPAMLILPICAAGLLIDGVASVSLAGLATVLIASLAWLEQNNFQPVSVLPPDIDLILPIFSATFWIGVFWSVAALTVLLANGLQRALKQSRAHADELSQLTAQLEQRVQTQTAALLEQEREAATLEERARVAREIHDTIAQGLTGIIVQLGAAERALFADSPDAPKHLQLAQQMARESLAEARRSIWNLRSPSLEHATLIDALQGIVARQTKPQTKFQVQGTVQTLPVAVESALLRVCQEALVNVAKHSNASCAEVVLEFLPSQVCLSINDDGIGFVGDVLQPSDSVMRGFGLLGMRERLSALGGMLELKSENGARVIATIPYGETKA